jgi:hypothetical protein
MGGWTSGLAGGGAVRRIDSDLDAKGDRAARSRGDVARFGIVVARTA